VQIGKQIVDLLLIENLGKAGHFISAESNDVRDPIIIGGHPAHREILALEHALHAGSLPSSRRVRRMAPVAIIVINAASRHLLRIESEFGIAFAPLDIAAGNGPEHYYRDAETQSKQFQVFNSTGARNTDARLFHLSFKAETKPLQ
jgi:hypothetical protein